MGIGLGFEVELGFEFEPLAEDVELDDGCLDTVEEVVEG